MILRHDNAEKSRRCRPWQRTMAGVALTGMLAGFCPASAGAELSSAQAEQSSLQVEKSSAQVEQSNLQAVAPFPAASGWAATANGAEANATLQPSTEEPSPEVEARIEHTIDLLRTEYPEFRSLYLQKKSRGDEIQMLENDRQVKRACWFVTFDERKPEEMRSDNRTESLHLQFDENGALQSYRWQNVNWAGDTMPDKATALHKGADFLQKLLGADFALYGPGKVNGTGSGCEVREGKVYTWVNRNVQFDRLVNGIPLVNGDDLWNVQVDGGGRVVGVSHFTNENTFDLTFDPARFPDPAKALSLEQAKKALMEQCRLAPAYVSREFLQDFPNGVQLVPGQGPPRLVYRPDRLFLFMDAITGKLLVEMAAMESGRPAHTVIHVTGEGKALFAKNTDEGRKVIEKELGVDLSGMPLFPVGSEPVNQGIGPYIRRMEWDTSMPHGDAPANTQPTPGGLRNAAIQTASDTGRVLGFSVKRNGHNASKEEASKHTPVISRDEAKKKAVAFLQQYLPARDLEVKVIQVWQGTPRYPDWVDVTKLPKNIVMSSSEAFRFIPLHQGIPVEGYNWSVSVDRETGKVSAFHYEPVDFDALPDPSRIISPETAEAAFMNNLDLKLVYTWSQYFDQRAPQPSLMYQYDFLHPGLIDAQTGSVISMESGE
ncbi:hypothetical protein GTO89_07865 [Heliobacterium gestii]|uniref:YcdB/YcdC repeated domain-containing protein n=1 Tax=Heliomicrobium gestii TaxID=2699 RepID=A0A845L9R0_HELGE|nr:YcdB/YcdC domain-containing protein [Heliomicrobium gestii]MBM7866256.1 hypothetical protein [Heliomicrobium gestii]MZP42948.1 hypothetical protein [Heliomicrobium gestii]